MNLWSEDTVSNTAIKNQRDPEKAVEVMHKYNTLAAKSFRLALISGQISREIGVPGLSQFFAAPRGDAEREMGQAFNELKVAQGISSELGRLGDRKKAYTTPKLNNMTGQWEFDPGAKIVFIAGMEQAGMSQETIENNLELVQPEINKNQELIDLLNSKQVPAAFFEANKDPLEAAATFKNAKAAFATNEFKAKEFEKKRVLAGQQDQGLSPAQQVSNTLEARGQPQIQETNTDVQSPLLPQPQRANAENLAQAQNRQTQKTPPQEIPQPIEPLSQSIAVTPTGASPLTSNFTPAPNFSLAAPDELERLKKRLGK